MSNPTMKIGRYRFRYIQVPYHDRFHVVDAGSNVVPGTWVEIARVSGAETSVIEDLIQMACQSQGGNRQQSIENYKKRVREHDEHLDNSPP